MDDVKIPILFCMYEKMKHNHSVIFALNMDTKIPGLTPISGISCNTGGSHITHIPTVFSHAHSTR